MGDQISQLFSVTPQCLTHVGATVVLILSGQRENINCLALTLKLFHLNTPDKNNYIYHVHLVINGTAWLGYLNITANVEE